MKKNYISKGVLSMRSLGWLIRYGAAAFLLMCGTTTALAEPPADLSDPALIAAGQKRFNQACFYCHGQDGVGGKGASLRNRPDLAPQFIFDTISNGRIRGSSVMPKWKNGLSEDQIWEITAFIVGLKDAK